MKAYSIPGKLIRMVKIMYDDFECSLLEEGKQDGLRSPLALKKDVSCQASFSCLLLTRQFEQQQKDIEMASDGTSQVCLKTSTLQTIDKYEHIQNKTNRLDNAGRVGLKLNTQKCKVMRMNTRRENKVMIGREEVEDVEEFLYLGATVTKESGGTEDIKKRLSKARGAFFNRKNIWNTRSGCCNTKIKLI